MSVYAHVASGASQTLVFTERYVLLRRRVDVLFSKTKIDSVYNVLLPVGVSANQEILRLYVTINEMFRMDVFYP